MRFGKQDFDKVGILPLELYGEPRVELGFLVKISHPSGYLGIGIKFRKERFMRERVTVFGGIRLFPSAVNRVRSQAVVTGVVTTGFILIWGKRLQEKVKCFGVLDYPVDLRQGYRSRPIT